MSFDTGVLDKVEPYANLAQVTRAQLAAWPEHAKFLQTRFRADAEDFLRRTDEVAKLVLLLAADRLDEFCRDYRWMCENFIDEELYFRRNKKYRLSTFAEAYSQVYSNTAYMSRYVNGILLSQLFWHNHAAAMDLFRVGFLPRLPTGFNHLEVGPGHGLFLAQAAGDTKCRSATGWDVSAASLAATAEALRKFGIYHRVTLIEQDVLKPTAATQQFDSAIISEVLEHLEQPLLALSNLFGNLRNGGWLCVNMPINSPAPDHIYLCRTAEDVTGLIKDSGFQVEELHELPMTGYTLERARKMPGSVSCVVFARKP